MKDENRAENNGLLSEAFEASAKRIVTVDVMKYDKFLEESGLSAEQREERLRAAWTIIMAFVELGFEVHPLQEVCGKDAEALDCARKKDSNESNPQEQQEELRRPDDGPKRG
jgi:hypothetical protein